MYLQNGLFTDLYSLTMMQGYFLKKRTDVAVFDMCVRDIDEDLGYMIFAGLQPLLENIIHFRFLKEDIDYLRSLGSFQESFLQYLLHFKFSGNIWALREGSLCFSHEPIIRVEAPIIEAQLLEGLILNIINFHTLIATKAARVCYAAKGRKVMEFGLRRAQGPNGAVYASRAAYIGGISSTSNVASGKEFNIPISGTMAHSWVMSYTHEIDSYKDFSELYPDNITFLLDTYDTLASGLPNAIRVGKELQKKGISFSVRLDSGDLEYLSKQVRTQLDAHGLHDVKIIATNNLNENIITQLLVSGAPIDAIGIGTNLITGGNMSTLSGVYKLVELIPKDSKKAIPLVKTSNNILKSSLPSAKKVYRFIHEDKYLADLITLVDEEAPQGETVFYHPYFEHKYTVRSKPYTVQSLLIQHIQDGALLDTSYSIHETRDFVKQELSRLDTTYLRLINPHVYHVSISQKLKDIRDMLLFSTKN